MRFSQLLWVFSAVLLIAGCGPTGVGLPTATPAIQASTPAESAAPTAASVSGTAVTLPTAASDTTAESSAIPSAPTVETTGSGIQIAPVAEGFSRPTYLTHAGDGSGRLFVTEQNGKIWIVRDGQRLETPFLDIESLVGSRSSEQGLLSVAFHPRYKENGLFFVDYTNTNGNTVVASYNVSSDPDVADPTSAKIILAVEQPAANHNGGLVKFGRDGYLYVGLGDGGAAGDPWGNGQSLGALLGKLLRIDIDNGEPYAVPPDNPFIDQPDAKPEIWAYGLRNPWRFSFDRLNGDLYIADVGQNAIEEIDYQPADSAGGENYGWNTMEGDSCYQSDECDQSNLVPPVAVYRHEGEDGGCSVTGGYVYRGSQFPQIAGTYFYADYCSGNLWTLKRSNGEWRSELVVRLDISPTSFGEDESGELYIVDGGGAIYQIVT